MLRAEALTVAIRRRVIVSGADLVLRPGEMTALVGPNGAGKTTLMRALAGLIPASAGRLTLKDRPLAAFTPREHDDLGRALGMDFDAAGSVSGARFVYLKGQIARLNRALAELQMGIGRTRDDDACDRRIGQDPVQVRDLSTGGESQLLSGSRNRIDNIFERDSRMSARVRGVNSSNPACADDCDIEHPKTPPAPVSQAPLF